MTGPILTEGRTSPERAEPVQRNEFFRLSSEVLLRYGFVAEWLGRGLQNLLQRFESARNLEMWSALKNRRMAVF
jgi:hypothetical protein